jgi:hypothetical protein
MDYNDSTVNNIKTIEKIVDFTKGAKLIVAMDSNSRSTTCYEVTTNSTGNLLKEFVASNQLHIINEDSTRTTFQSSRGKSNIDITITNNQMLADIKNWQISEEESVSDHNIIKFNIKLDRDETKINNSPGLRYIIKEQQKTEFYEILYHTICKTFQIEDRDGRDEDIVGELNRLLKGLTDIRQFTVKIQEVIQITCRKTCKHIHPPNPKAKGRQFRGGRTP